jgi:predicted 2-oxoglutarate/Fe(II)-dependent dioxygenase YbiX
VLKHVTTALRLPPVDGHAATEICAPILILPRVFEPQFCKDLIKLYERQGGQESGFMREKEGKTVEVKGQGFKRRKDLNLDESADYEPIRAAVRARFLRRIVPEIKKAYQFEVTRIERYIVACYEGTSGGFFRAHRDNTTKGTAHRRFVCTINLNAEDYDGGDLRFPEFGSRTYRAPTGGAVVFSCSCCMRRCR